mmetsp:Transcript_36906/g.88872  ORF Transcript_36906/g.88872 Transcript_36906/m.88872 type:complete len:123 (+) Transcript_36906:88-456(+)
MRGVTSIKRVLVDGVMGSRHDGDAFQQEKMKDGGNSGTFSAAIVVGVGGALIGMAIAPKLTPNMCKVCSATLVAVGCTTMIATSPGLPKAADPESLVDVDSSSDLDSREGSFASTMSFSTDR